ncbi:MAG: Stp1/IreP family PP2C-type Ser/Thr phosphatase [Clostridiales Family XIII bacterium]|jgi:protein phosphatase|nr:Stp1/IreP family PP2C-type Ser/Thr phosphatase [Clostridiales Family XIII bacterium]
MAKAGFRTDTGRLRSNNEDALLVLPRVRTYAVADGVGGHNSGEVASRKAVTGFEKYLDENDLDKAHDGEDSKSALMEYFLECLEGINADIRETAEDRPECAGMATTLVAAHVSDDKLYVVNIGDSRAYIVRDGKISQITIDHTVVNKMVANGELSAEEARNHPRKNEITRALGAEEGICPDFFVTELCHGDRVVLCSDGLYGEVPDEEICNTVSLGEDLNEICKSLVDKANERGGRDNITVICLEI